MNKKKIKTCCLISGVDLDYTLCDLIDRLNVYMITYGMYDNLRIVEAFDYDRYRYNLCGDRLETDEEYEERVKSEKLRQETIDKTDRMIYERLKTKFGE